MARFEVRPSPIKPSSDVKRVTANVAVAVAAPLLPSCCCCWCSALACWRCAALPQSASRRVASSLAIYPAMHIKPHDLYLYLPHCSPVCRSVCLSCPVCLCESASPLNSPALSCCPVTILLSPLSLSLSHSVVHGYVRVQFRFSSALTVHIELILFYKFSIQHRLRLLLSPHSPLLSTELHSTLVSTKLHSTLLTLHLARSSSMLSPHK